MGWVGCMLACLIIAEQIMVINFVHHILKEETGRKIQDTQKETSLHPLIQHWIAAGCYLAMTQLRYFYNFLLP